MQATLDTVQQLEDRLAQLRNELAETRTAAKEAARAARTALAKGEKADSLIRRQTDIDAKAQALAGAVADLEAQIKEDREAACQDEADRRMLGIKRAYTSLIDQRDKDVQRIEQASVTLIDAVKRLNDRTDDLDSLLAEALVLHERFKIELPDLPRVLRPARVDRVTAAMNRANGVQPAAGSMMPPSLGQMPHRGGVDWTIRRILSRIAGTPTAALLELAGTGLLEDMQGWERRRMREQGEKRAAEDADRRAEIKRYDDWLSAFLSEGPRLLEGVEREAATVELRLRRERNHQGQSIYEAAARLGVVMIVEHPGGAPFWALPNRWDRERFLLHQPRTSSLAGMR